jgi:hypothetical protein
LPAERDSGRITGNMKRPRRTVTATFDDGAGCHAEWISVFTEVRRDFSTWSARARR